MSSIPDPVQTDRLTIALADQPATEALAAAIAHCLSPGWVIHLSGDLGAGKTTFVRALLRALGYTGKVRSPTFTVAEPYSVHGLDILHCDFYRFTREAEWREAGLGDAVGSNTIVLIEWPEMAGDDLPQPDLHLTLRWTSHEVSPGIARDERRDEDDLERIAMLQAYSPRAQTCLGSLAH